MKEAEIKSYNAKVGELSIFDLNPVEARSAPLPICPSTPLLTLSLSSPYPLSSLSSHPVLTLLTPKLSRQMTLVNYRLLALIAPSEFCQRRFLCKEQSPGLAQVTAHFSFVPSLLVNILLLLTLPILTLRLSHSNLNLVVIDRALGEL